MTALLLRKEGSCVCWNCSSEMFSIGAEKHTCNFFTCDRGRELGSKKMEDRETGGSVQLFNHIGPSNKPQQSPQKLLRGCDKGENRVGGEEGQLEKELVMGEIRVIWIL